MVIRTAPEFPTLRMYFAVEGSLTRAEVCRRLGISKQQLSMIERGRREASLTLAFRIVALCKGVSLRSLVRGHVPEEVAS